MKRNLWQVVIALDQLANCLTADGWADETLSAHAWRSRNKSRAWGFARQVIDWLFFFDPYHCQMSYASELYRRHSPPEQRPTL